MPWAQGRGSKGKLGPTRFGAAVEADPECQAERRKQIPIRFGVEGDAGAARQVTERSCPQKTPDSQRSGAEEEAASKGVHAGYARPGLMPRDGRPTGLILPIWETVNHGVSASR